MISTRMGTGARGSTGRRRAARRPGFESIEGRCLLAATIWTVDGTGLTGAGLGQAGDLLYCVRGADADTNVDGDFIQFNPDVFATPQTIAVPDGGLRLSNTTGLQVIAAPPAPVTLSGTSAGGYGSDLTIQSGVDAQIYGLTFTGGAAALGGGVYNGGTLALVGCTISGNSTTTAASDSTVGTGGGGLFNGGLLTIYQCSISGNTALGPAEPGGNVTQGGGFLNGGTCSMFDSTVSGNSATGGPTCLGGGIFNSSGGLLAMVNVTISGNALADNLLSGTQDHFGAGAGLDNTGGVTAINCTIAGNAARSGDQGGGIGGSARLSLSLQNCIVASNTAGSAASDIGSESFIYAPNSGDNLIGAGGSGGLVDGASGDVVGVADPMLAPLADNGGRTRTRALLAGSRAIGAGGVAYVSDALFFGPPATDQRGVGFARVVGGTVDVGAYQTQAVAG